MTTTTLLQLLFTLNFMLYVGKDWMAEYHFLQPTIGPLTILSTADLIGLAENTPTARQDFGRLPTWLGMAAVAALDLDYVVITSVNRDDLADGGAAHWAATVRAVRRHAPRCRVEALIPDFQGRAASLRAVVEAGPDVLNHNTETVPRLYRVARPGGRYEWVLELFRRARAWAPQLRTKSGLILGLGETRDELVATFRDLRAVDVEILTLGQYLRPSPAHLPVARYYHPDEFAELAAVARDLGFAYVEAGPLVRSSYHAKRQTLAAERA